MTPKTPEEVAARVKVIDDALHLLSPDCDDERREAIMALFELRRAALIGVERKR